MKEKAYKKNNINNENEQTKEKASESQWRMK